MTRAEKCAWLVSVWREHHDATYARVAQHMFVGASPADICLFEGISQAQLRGIIIALASSLAEGLS